MTEAQLLAEVVRRVVTALEPRRLILFGSRARGEAKPDSDVDLLVVWRNETPPHERSAAVRRALRGISVAFDIAVVTPSEYERFAGRKAHIVAIAAREGRVLYAA